MEQMQRALKEISDQRAQPVNVDWTPSFEHLQRLQTQVVETVASNHQDSIQRLSSQLDTRIVQALEALSSSKQREESHSIELQELRRGVLDCQMSTASIKESVDKSQMQFEQLLQEQNEGQGKKVQQNMQDMLDGQSMVFHHLEQIEPMLERSIGDQLSDSKSVAQAQSKLINEIHTTVHGDILCLFTEVGKIQQALNIPFIAAAPHAKVFDREGICCREFAVQTDDKRFYDNCTQTEEGVLASVKKHVKKKIKIGGPTAAATLIRPQQEPLPCKKQVFADEEAMKAKMRQALIRPSYNTMNQYHTSGCCQAIARSSFFENTTFLVIMMNAFWIAVDTDHNEAQLLIDAQPVFQVAENVFCTYFFAELWVRFGAFAKKRDCLRDFWFSFDAILVFSMAVETWVITIIMLAFGPSEGSANLGSFSILRLARLVKMCRMARMARLLRMVPELIVIIRGIGVAFRSVAFFILLTAIIIYVFAVAFTQVSKDSELGKEYFPTVPEAMNRLLLDGMLPLYSVMIKAVADENVLYVPVIMLYVLLASVTVMNMLIGVLVEVVRTVAATEKEGMTVTHVTQSLYKVMSAFQNGGDGAKMAKESSLTMKKKKTKIDMEQISAQYKGCLLREDLRSS
jgi:hypothetical protein